MQHRLDRDLTGLSLRGLRQSESQDAVLNIRFNRAGIDRLWQTNAALELAITTLKHERAAVFLRRLLRDFARNGQHTVVKADIHCISGDTGDSRADGVILIRLMDVERQRADISRTAQSARVILEQLIQRALHCSHFTNWVPAYNGSHLISSTDIAYSICYEHYDKGGA